MTGPRQPGAGDAPPGTLEVPGALEVFVYYDFASSLSYVAHRVLARIDEPLRQEGIDLRWKALDLTGVGNFRRGRLLDAARRQSLVRVASALGVELEPPSRWPDSRLAGEVAVLLDGEAGARAARSIEREWREAAFAVYHEVGAAREPAVAVGGDAAASGADRPVGKASGVLPRERSAYGRPAADAGRGGRDGTAGDRTAMDGGNPSIEGLLREFEPRLPFRLGATDDLAAGQRLAEATRSAVAVGVEGVPTLMLDVFPLCGIHDEETMLGMIQRYARRRRRLAADTAAGVN